MQAHFQTTQKDDPATVVTKSKSLVTDSTPVASPASPRRRPAQTITHPAITHPDRVLWPAANGTRAVTKADLAAYYALYADRILAQIGGRPLSVLRAPDGITGELFFQRHIVRGQSPLIGVVPIAGQPRPFLRVDNAAALRALAQIAVVELHPWGALAETPDVPDRLVFDLDPAEDLPFAAVIDAALMVRARLKAVGLEAFARVTGGKGMHVVVPLVTPKRGAPPGWPEAKQFTRLVCLAMERDAPDRYTTTLSKQARGGKIFLDYLRNDRMATAIGGWSPRGRAGAPIARPVAWAAVKPGLDPAGWWLPEMLDAREPSTPWADFNAAAGDLRAAIATAAKA